MASQTSRPKGGRKGAGTRLREKLVGKGPLSASDDLQVALSYQLIQAAWRGETHRIFGLIELGAQVNSPWGHPQLRPLICAAEAGHLEFVDLLIKNGAEVDVGNNKGVTPLMVASVRGHIQIVELLVSKGAMVDAMAMGGWTALMFAAANGRTETVKFLLEKGARPHLMDAEYRRTPLDWAEVGGHTETAELLRGWKENNANSQ